MGVVIREIHLSHKAGRMECEFYSVVCSLCVFVVAVYFITNCILSYWILTSYNN
jgi:hypothetical protein